MNSTAITSGLVLTSIPIPMIPLLTPNISNFITPLPFYLSSMFSTTHQMAGVSQTLLSTSSHTPQTTIRSTPFKGIMASSLDLRHSPYYIPHQKIYLIQDQLHQNHISSHRKAPFRSPIQTLLSLELLTTSYPIFPSSQITIQLVVTNRAGLHPLRLYHTDLAIIKPKAYQTSFNQQS